MISSKPYIIRAIHEWILDSDLTPYLLINTHIDTCDVPERCIAKDGSVVFNINPSVVADLSLGNEEISFTARFSGQPQYISIPVAAVVAIYAKENRKGFFFDLINEKKHTQAKFSRAKKKRPVLKIVK